jgi:C4-dicarboxylate transporter DctM subunit
VTVNRLPALLEGFMQDHVGSRVLFLILLNVVLLLIGMFMESFSAVIVFLPILFPVALTFGIDPVHFGIIATVNLAIGYITPPYGATLFVACGISGQSVRAVTARVLPILAAMILVLILVTYVPQSFMWIPRLMGK